MSSLWHQLNPCKCRTNASMREPLGFERFLEVALGNYASGHFRFDASFTTTVLYFDIVLEA